MLHWQHHELLLENSLATNITYPTEVDGLKISDPLEHLLVKYYRNKDGSIHREAFDVAQTWIHWFASYTTQLAMFKQEVVFRMPTEQSIHNAHEGAAFRLMAYNSFWRVHVQSLLPLIVQETVQLNTASHLDDHTAVVALMSIRWGYLSYIAGLVTGDMLVQKEFDIELRKLLSTINDEFLKKLPEMLKARQGD